MTIISDALDRAGFDRKKFELRVVLKNFLGCGGSRADVIAILDELRSEDQIGIVREDRGRGVPAPLPLPREGQAIRVDHDHQVSADARQPIAGEGHSARVQQDHSDPSPAGDPLPDVSQPQRVENDRHPSADIRKPLSNPLPDVGHRSSVEHDHPTPADTRKPLMGGKANSPVPGKAKATPPPAHEPDKAYLEAIADTARRTAKVQLELLKTSTGQLWGGVKPHEFPGMERDGHIAWAIRDVYGPFSAKQEHLPLRDFLPDEIFKKALIRAEVAYVR